MKKEIVNRQISRCYPLKMKAKREYITDKIYTILYYLMILVKAVI